MHEGAHEVVELVQDAVDHLDEQVPLLGGVRDGVRVGVRDGVDQLDEQVALLGGQG